MNIKQLLFLILGLIVRMLIVGLVIYIIWGREGIDALHSLGERIPPVIIILGLVAGICYCSRSCN